MKALAKTLWRSTRRHPERHPAGFGSVVGSYALAELESRAAGEIRIPITTLRPLTEPGSRRILVTHGAPVLQDGSLALEAALAAGQWGR